MRVSMYSLIPIRRFCYLKKCMEKKRAIYESILDCEKTNQIKDRVMDTIYKLVILSKYESIPCERFTSDPNNHF